MRQRHAEDRVARLQRSEEYGLIRLGPRVRLDVREFGVKELLGAVDRELLGDVDIFAAAVVTLAGIALGVLVGELRALRSEHRTARVILRRNQFDMIFLTCMLAGDGGPQIRVGLRERERAMGHGDPEAVSGGFVF